MMLWLVFALMVLASLASLLYPLLRRQGAVALYQNYDIDVYRDQLGEIERDFAKGLLTPEQENAARMEIERRILAASYSNTALGGAANSRGSLILALIIAIGLPISAGLMYYALGNPALPGKPFAGRIHDPDFIMAVTADKLAASLEKKPDAQGYHYLAEMYFLLHRYGEAAEAYQKIIAMKGGNAQVWAGLGEAMVLSQDGKVMPEARKAFAEALKRDPKDARARYYSGLAEMQDGHNAKALAIWRDLEKDSPPDAAWMGMLKENIAMLLKKEGLKHE